MNNIQFYLARVISAIVGVIWCYIEPTMPFLVICLTAIVIDCYTAWRCNRRLCAYYKRKGLKSSEYNGKLKSTKMFKMLGDFTVVMLCVVLAYNIDNRLLGHIGGLYLAQYVSAIYCVVQFVSILENESTCNDAKWAKILQRFVADKAERHLGVSLDDLTDGTKDNSETEVDK